MADEQMPKTKDAPGGARDSPLEGSPKRYKVAERVIMIPLEQLKPFKDHPFKVRDDDELMQNTIDSIMASGVINPILVRPDHQGGYEVVSGHRRLRASQLAGLETIKSIVRDMDDDTAVITMVDSNLQREDLLPSERAFSYRMKLEAMKRQGERVDLTCRQVGDKLKAADILGEQIGESARQVQRFVRLTYLDPKLMEMVDNKKLAFNPAVELSYLKPEEQTDFLSAMEYGQATPSLSQAQRLKKLSQNGECTMEAMCEIMSEEKKDGLDRITLKTDDLRKYFPKSYTPQQMQTVIMKLLDAWQKKQQRDKAR